MSLDFRNRRVIPAGVHGSRRPWLDGVALGALDRAQLLAVLRLFHPALTEAEMLAGDADYFHAHDVTLAEVPVEWWDVGDELQLWLCNADTGFVFDAGTTNRRAAIVQWAFDPDRELPRATRAAIAAEAARAIAARPDSLLRSVVF